MRRNKSEVRKCNGVWCGCYEEPAWKYSLCARLTGLDFFSLKWWGTIGSFYARSAN